MLDTSGELFIINLTLEIGSEMVFLLAEVGSSFSGVLPDIFEPAQRETDLQVVLKCDAVLLRSLIRVRSYRRCVLSPPSGPESTLRPAGQTGALLLSSSPMVALN